ncbi:selenocysteine-specific translation elongation factor [Oryzobacter sp. R7]|uniref:selenocysteine-specific translation elongation factor n=1 Tax=Oryzobacter faecalis TaxID=3388656 RepID=UPI00398CE9B8
MAVVATAGHVDHGKSALVRALTGTDPDRLPEERRRGLTIELGHARLDLDDGRGVFLVDVPGHDRLVGTTIAGVGPAGGVLLVVAADEGWSAQTEEHLTAVRALGLTRLALAVTKTDLAPGDAVLADALGRLARHGLDPVATALTSARTGAGLADARTALRALVDAAPPADTGAPVRLWVDRSFTVAGSGTVVTGTLPAGTVRVGDVLEVGGTRVTVRGLQVHGDAVRCASAPTRLAVNLRGVPVADVPRGSLLATPGVASAATVVDVLLHRLARTTPTHAVLHVGTAAAPVRVRPLGEDAARLTVEGDPLPLVVGDRVLLRDPGAHEVVAGADVVAVDPAPFTRRGEAARRAVALTTGDHPPQEGATDHPARGDHTAAGDHAAASVPPACDPAVAAVVASLAARPFAAVPANLLADPAVTPAALARAEAAGLLLRVGGVVVAGDAVERARARLGELGEPFGPGDLARLLGTSRRVAVALLGRLDSDGTTRRLPDGTRVLRRPV